MTTPSYGPLDRHLLDACKEHLNAALISFGNWCINRANGDHDQYTTLTMLKRRATDIESAVNKAGWRAITEFNQANETKDL